MKLLNHIATALRAKEAAPSYVKTTGKSRRAAALAATAALMESCADDPRKPGFVAKKPRNAARDATRTKGKPYSRFGVVQLIPADPFMPGSIGYVLMQNRGNQKRSSKRKPNATLVLNAQQAYGLIPAGLHKMMGVEAPQTQEV